MKDLSQQGAGRARRRPRRRDERGVVLVLWTVALTALLGFVAMALDLGNLVQSGTNVQDAADAAALAGAMGTKQQDWSPGALLTNVQDVVDSYLANDTLQWGLQSCSSEVTSADVPTGSSQWTPVPSTDCVYYDSDLGVVWVGVPPVNVPSLFGSLGGGTLERYSFAFYSASAGEAKLCNYPDNCWSP